MIHKCFTFYLFKTMSRKVDNNNLTYIYYQLDSEQDSSGPLYHSDSTIVETDPDSLKDHSSEQSYFVPKLRRTKSILMKDRIPDFSNSLFDSTDDSTPSKIEMAAHRPRRNRCCPASPFVHNFCP
ncbi:unnamed protein product [Arctogadus glacialis]